MYEYHAVVTSVHDGDTLRCRVDLGCDVHIDLVLRFNGINAPELNTEKGKVAHQYALSWLDTHAPGGVFLLRTIKDHKEKYGRYLAEVWDISGAHCLNADLITSGNAVVYNP